MLADLVEDKLSCYDHIDYLHFLKIFEDEKMTQDSKVSNLSGFGGNGHGSIGHWLENEASEVDKTTFLEFMTTMDTFSKKHKLNKCTEDDVLPSSQDHVVLRLGPSLRVGLHFYIDSEELHLKK